MFCSFQDSLRISSRLFTALPPTAMMSMVPATVMTAMMAMLMMSTMVTTVVTVMPTMMMSTTAAAAIILSPAIMRRRPMALAMTRVLPLELMLDHIRRDRAHGTTKQRP